MENKYQKCLRAVKKDYGDKPSLIYFKDAYEEAEWVADQVKAFYDQGMELSHQCILFRSAYITIPLQAELSKRDIPFAVHGGLKFYETAHVKDLIAHLKLFINHKDELAWSRVLLLIGGIGPRTVEKLLDEMAAYQTLESIVESVLQKYSPGGKSSEGLTRLTRLLLRAPGEPGTLCQAVIDYYDPILKEKFDIDWRLRKNDLEAVAQISGRYGSIRDLLVDLAIEPPERGVKDFHDTVWERPLILSTIHSAKGLEWRNVILIGAIDGVLPSSYTTHYDEELEEEHRLLYVAVTRARERFFILAHHEGLNNGIHTFNRLSRFIEAANVKALLDQKVTFSAGLTGQEDVQSGEGFSKADLLSKLLDSMK